MIAAPQRIEADGDTRAKVQILLAHARDDCCRREGWMLLAAERIVDAYLKQKGS